MPLLEKVETEDGKQVGTLEDGRKFLLSEPVSGFKHQNISQGGGHRDLRANLQNQAAHDEDYYYQEGTYKQVHSGEVITYIRWCGELIEEEKEN